MSKNVQLQNWIQRLLKAWRLCHKAISEPTACIPGVACCITEASRSLFAKHKYRSAEGRWVQLSTYALKEFQRWPSSLLAVKGTVTGLVLHMLCYSHFLTATLNDSAMSPANSRDILSARLGTAACVHWRRHTPRCLKSQGVPDTVGSQTDLVFTPFTLDTKRPGWAQARLGLFANARIDLRKLNSESFPTINFFFVKKISAGALWAAALSNAVSRTTWT